MSQSTARPVWGPKVQQKQKHTEDSLCKILLVEKQAKKEHLATNVCPFKIPTNVCALKSSLGKDSSHFLRKGICFRNWRVSFQQHGACWLLLTTVAEPAKPRVKVSEAQQSLITRKCHRVPCRQVYLERKEVSFHIHKKVCWRKTGLLLDTELHVQLSCF